MLTSMTSNVHYISMGQILDTLTDSWKTADELADDLGMTPTRCREYCAYLSDKEMCVVNYKPSIPGDEFTFVGYFKRKQSWGKPIDTSQAVDPELLFDAHRSTSMARRDGSTGALESEY